MAEIAPNTNDRGNGDDPLGSLHRMSTTAGVSSQEYVAINLTAVAAILAGLATMLVFLSPLWLPVPVLAIVFGIVALRQIGHSNGTQAGRLLAWGGIVAALLICGFYGGGAYSHWASMQKGKVGVLTTCDTLEQALLKEDYPKAWALFSDRFRTEKKLDLAQFEKRWKALQSTEAGRFRSVKSNNLIEVQAGPAGTQAVAATMLVISWDSAPRVGRYTVLLSNRNGSWEIDDLPLIFPSPEPAPGAPGRGPAPSGPQ